MNLYVADDYQALSVAAAEVVQEILMAKPDAVLLMPTGNTPVGLYRELVARSQSGRVDLSQATVFMLDEYIGIPSSHPQSFRRFIEEHFTSQVSVKRHEAPDGTAVNLAAEAVRYERALAQAGGPDLTVLGIGANGHIGFNEPGSTGESLTRVVELGQTTRRDSAKGFGGLAQTPVQGITVGVGTIMTARTVLLLVSGSNKAEVLFRALHGPVGPDCPASYLQAHPGLRVIVDQAAAEELSKIQR